MSDVMHTVRELLEGQPPTMAVLGTVIHAVRVPTSDPTDPYLYELVMEITGYTYFCMAFTRDPRYVELIPDGEELLISQPSPEQEGYPIFLRLVNPIPLPAAQYPMGARPPVALVPLPTGEPIAPIMPQAQPAQNVPPAPAAPSKPEPAAEPLLDKHGVKNETEEEEEIAALPFDPTTRDTMRQDNQQ